MGELQDRAERYEALAKALMDAPDPVYAIASVIGDHEARLQILATRVLSLEHAESQRRTIEGRGA